MQSWEAFQQSREVRNSVGPALGRQRRFIAKTRASRTCIPSSPVVTGPQQKMHCPSQTPVYLWPPPRARPESAGVQFLRFLLVTAHCWAALRNDCCTRGRQFYMTSPVETVLLQDVVSGSIKTKSCRAARLRFIPKITANNARVTVSLSSPVSLHSMISTCLHMSLHRVTLGHPYRHLSVALPPQASSRETIAPTPGEWHDSVCLFCL